MLSFVALILFSSPAFACDDMEYWDYPMEMCMPLAMKDMPMTMLMVQGNAFGVQSWQNGPRGREAFAAPNMIMADLGTSVADHHYLAMDFMGTVERWTFPNAGYPELLQTGEQQANGAPYLDAQHPHSSPIMGLTLSDTITLDHDKDHLKFWFAPRGESSDGPIAFMHRPTGMVNPDAPLGHHIGQDAGHISSTVVGGALQVSHATLELSTFNGTEPAPSKVDLPMATPNSYAARLTQQFTSHLFAMASAAYVKNPEPNEQVRRYSASVYADAQTAGWTFHNALIWGLINGYDNTPALNSFAEEYCFQKQADSFWGRLEILQRTPAELDIVDDDVNRGRWITAATLGYTRQIGHWDSADLGLGASFTQDYLTGALRSAYGGNPITARVFLQASGKKMWDLSSSN